MWFLKKKLLVSIKYEKSVDLLGLFSYIFISCLQLSAYAPFVQRCSLSSVLKTRVLAARALVPLVAPNVYPALLQELVTISAVKCTTENYRHGLLLQVINLFFFYLVYFPVEDFLTSPCLSINSSTSLYECSNPRTSSRCFICGWNQIKITEIYLKTCVHSCMHPQCKLLGNYWIKKCIKQKLQRRRNRHFQSKN